LSKLELLKKFNQDYSSSNILIEKNKIKKVQPDESQSTIEAIADDLGNVVTEPSKNISIKEVESENEQPEQKKDPVTKRVFDKGSLSGVKDISKAGLDKVKNAGGISLLLFVIIFILFAIQPVNGRTRLTLAWRSLLGRTTLDDNPPPPPSTTVATGEALGGYKIEQNNYDGSYSADFNNIPDWIEWAPNKISQVGQDIGNTTANWIIDGVGGWFK
jgi:hypothetical protein